MDEEYRFYEDENNSFHNEYEWDKRKEKGRSNANMLKNVIALLSVLISILDIIGSNLKKSNDE